jgi:hypothetical protein
MSRLSLVVFWISLILVGCRLPADEAVAAHAVLLIPSPASISPLVTPTVSSALPTPTFTPTPTVTPTRAPTITPFPTLHPSALEPESLSRMVVREVVVSDFVAQWEELPDVYLIKLKDP